MDIAKIAVPVLPGAGSPSPKKIADAAGQFETLMIAQMLKSMREEGGGWLGTGDDAAGASAMSMAEEHLASALTAGGGLGLAHMVEAGLKSKGSIQN
jgi:Rod binding domain-containing protein